MQFGFEMEQRHKANVDEMFEGNCRPIYDEGDERLEDDMGWIERELGFQANGREVGNVNVDQRDMHGENAVQGNGIGNGNGAGIGQDQDLARNQAQNLTRNQNLDLNLSQNLSQNLTRNQNLDQNMSQNLSQDLNENQNLNQNLSQNLNQNPNQNLISNQTIRDLPHTQTNNHQQTQNNNISCNNQSEVHDLRLQTVEADSVNGVRVIINKQNFNKNNGNSGHNAKTTLKHISISFPDQNPCNSTQSNLHINKSSKINQNPKTDKIQSQKIANKPQHQNLIPRISNKQIKEKLQFRSKFEPKTQNTSQKNKLSKVSNFENRNKIHVHQIRALGDRNKTSIHILASPVREEPSIEPNFRLIDELEKNSDLSQTISSKATSSSDPIFRPNQNLLKKIFHESETKNLKINPTKTPNQDSSSKNADLNPILINIANKPQIQPKAPEIQLQNPQINTPNPLNTIVHSQNIPKHYQSPLKPHLYDSQSTRSTLNLQDPPSPHNTNPTNPPPQNPTFNSNLPQFDERSDVWSAGCVLAELLLGRPIFSSIRDATSLSRALIQLFGPTPTNSLLAKALATPPGTFNPTNPNFNPYISNSTTSAKPLLAFLDKRAPAANHTLRDLLVAMLSPELDQRPTCLEALEHPCFRDFDLGSASASLTSKLDNINLNCHEASARKRAMSKVKRRRVQAQRGSKAPLGSNSLNKSSGKRRTLLKGKGSTG